MSASQEPMPPLPKVRDLRHRSQVGLLEATHRAAESQWTSKCEALERAARSAEQRATHAKSNELKVRAEYERLKHRTLIASIIAAIAAATLAVVCILN
jgi:hypothetical protein